MIRTFYRIYQDSQIVAEFYDLRAARIQADFHFMANKQPIRICQVDEYGNGLENVTLVDIYYLLSQGRGE